MKNVSVVMMDINSIIPYKNNPRLNNRAITVVAESIQEFGFKNPIVVDKNYEIIVGHTRLEASKMLGYKEVPVIIADDLTDEQVKAFRIMDNKSSEFAEWDYNKLLEEVNALIDMDYSTELTGFSDIELADIIDMTLEQEEKKVQEEKPEIEFTDELLEEYQYVVLYFDNTVDWTKAKHVLGLDTVKALRSRDDRMRTGTRRIMRGAEIIDRLGGEI